MGNGLTRLQTRFLGEPDSVGRARAQIGATARRDAAEELGLVTFAYDETDWDDEVRIMLEERASFSPDALTGMEANLRFAGPETMETRIFGRLTAWQNWIFQRPNAVGESGALKRYGSGVQPNTINNAYRKVFWFFFSKKNRCFLCPGDPDARRHHQCRL